MKNDVPPRLGAVPGARLALVVTVGIGLAACATGPLGPGTAKRLYVELPAPPQAPMVLVGPGGFDISGTPNGVPDDAPNNASNNAPNNQGAEQHIPPQYQEPLRQRERAIARALQAAEGLGEYPMTTYSVKIGGEHLWRQAEGRAYLLGSDPAGAGALARDELPLVWTVVAKAGMALSRYEFVGRGRCTAERLPVTSQDSIQIHPGRRSYDLEQTVGTTSAGLFGASGNRRRANIARLNLPPASIQFYKRGQRSALCGTADLPKDAQTPGHFHFEINDRCLSLRNLALPGINGMVTYIERDNSGRGCAEAGATSPRYATLTARPRLLHNDGREASAAWQQQVVGPLRLTVGDHALRASGLSFAAAIPRGGFDSDAKVTTDSACVYLSERFSAGEIADEPDGLMIPTYFKGPIEFWLLDTDRSWIDLIVNWKQQEGEQVYAGILDALLNTDAPNTGGAVDSASADGLSAGQSSADGLRTRIVEIVTADGGAARHGSGCAAPPPAFSTTPNGREQTLLPAFSAQGELDGRTLGEQLQSVAAWLRNHPGLSMNDLSGVTAAVLVSSLAQSGELGAEDRQLLQDAIGNGMGLKFVNIGRVMAGQQQLALRLDRLIGEQRTEVQYLEINAPEAVHADNINGFVERFSTELSR